jgi:hypothetical protein
MKEEEKKEKELEEEKKERFKPPNFLARVPMIWKFGGIAWVFIKYTEITQKNGQISQLFIHVALVLIMWWVIGSGAPIKDKKILTPEEALDEVDKHVKWLKRKNRIAKFARVYIGPNAGLFHSEALPQHYLIGVEIEENNNLSHYQATVYAVGDSRGYVTLQESSTKITGREPIPVKFPVPASWKAASSQLDLKFDDILFGKGQK